jgi:hypothetical protein
MINLTQFEVAGTVWSIEQPTENVCNLMIQVVTEFREQRKESFITVKLFGGLMAKAVLQCVPGEPVRVTGKINSREYNDKHYIDLIGGNLFCTERKEPKPKAEPTTPGLTDDNDLPF